jgi:PAS domain S-box-containing protein
LIDLERNILKKTTSRRITQNTLQADSEEKLRLILEAVSEAIVVTDLNGKIQQANRAALISYGYTGNAEFTGQSALRYVIFSDRHKLLKNIRQIRQSGISRTAEYTLLKPDGSAYPAQCSISLLKNSLELPQGFVICIRDSTAVAQFEKCRLHHERRYRFITENTSDFIALITPEGYYAYLSPSYARLGYDPSALIGRQSLELIHPDDQKTVIALLLQYSGLDPYDLSRLLQQNYSQRLAYRIKDANGNWHQMATTGNILESHDENGYNLLLISREVTASKNASAELKSLYAKEKALRTALEKEINKRANFFHALVHELKTPLTPIMVSSETLKDLAPNVTFSNLAGNVYNSALRLNNRIDALLDISRCELGLMKLNLDKVDITLLLKDIVNYVTPQIAQNRQSLISDIPDNLPQVMGEEMRLRQVILNLLDNAMRFTPANGSILLQALADANYLMVKVKDSGKGIGTADRERIFQPYNRIEADRQHFSGLGLGLALCKQLIELHKGRIWVENSSDSGSTFFFSLPTAANTAVKKEETNLPDRSDQSNDLW